MVKLATFSTLFILALGLSWTGYKAANAQDSPAAQTRSATQSATQSATRAVDLQGDAAYRHRSGLPRHWRGYILNQNGF